MRCGRLDPRLLGESWDQVERTSTSPTGFACAHNFLNFACNVPIQSDGMSLYRHIFSIFVLPASDQIEALPKAGHARRRSGAWDLCEITR
jgi:hypothetical protein